MAGQRGRAPLLPIVAALAVVLGACAGRPSEPPASPSPSDSVATSSAGAAATQPAPSVTSSPSPAPSWTPGAAATLPPETELEALLPQFAGGDYLTRRPLTAADVTGDGAGDSERRVFSALFAAIGGSDGFEAASATGSPMSIVAMRIAGMAPGALADAFVDASLAVAGGGRVTTREVGGREVRTIHWPDASRMADLHVMVEAGVVYVAGGYDTKQAVIDDVLATMFDPRLEVVLPAQLDGRPLTRYTMPGAAFPAGGDVCSFVCPGEPQRVADELGIDIGDVDLAIGYLETPPGVLLVAMRFEGAATGRLVDARIASIEGSSGEAPRRESTLGGKRVTEVWYGPFDSWDQREILYAHDDLLFIVRGAPDPNGDVPPIAAAAIAALP